MNGPHCTYCGKEVSIRTAYRKVEGWVRLRMAGGSNQITLQQSLHEWACPECIDRIKRTGSAEQTTLV